MSEIAERLPDSEGPTLSGRDLPFERLDVLSTHFVVQYVGDLI